MCADEGWDISWSDVDTLEKKCRESMVNGVLAGFSEFRVENMIRLCERLKLPCSLTMHQLDVTRDKVLFKDACRTFGLKTIPEYNISDSNICFPVIVKPVDRAGSIGVNVVYNKENLLKSYETALQLSPSRHVIIEDYITNGTKVDVYYYVKDNTVTFLGSSDTIMCKGELGAKILQKAWPFKSKYEKLYLQDVDSRVRRMLEGLGINNAYATMSMFYVDGEFYFFEAGFRLSGEMSYHYYESVSGLNYLDSMIKFSMGDKDETVFFDYFEKDKCFVVLNFFGLNGTVDKIKGVDVLSSSENVYDIKLYVRERDTITNETNVFHKVAMFTIVVDNTEKLFSVVDKVNKTFDIIDKKGKSLIYERVSQDELKDYYKA